MTLELTLHTTKGLDKDRVVNLRPTIVVAFCDIPSTTYATNPYGPSHFWNCDETGVQIGINRAMRVLAKRGSKSISYIIPKSRECITIIYCVNAFSKSIPSFYLFMGKRQLHNYITNCELGACMVV